MFVETDFSELIMPAGVTISDNESDRIDAGVDASLKSDVLRRVNHFSKGAFRGLDLDSVTGVIGFRPGSKGGLRVE
ncbi:FAD dependent oxidoreductase [Diplocarpon rosae]|nr:FAD dependent oxidoreductase [Diplocarpon rosae]